LWKNEFSRYASYLFIATREIIEMYSEMKSYSEQMRDEIDGELQATKLLQVGFRTYLKRDHQLALIP
jgi:hypothetical protein